MSDFLQSIIDRDPAAKSKLSLILTYPGVKAVFFHRIANFFSTAKVHLIASCLLYTSPSPRDATLSRMPSSA